MDPGITRGSGRLTDAEDVKGKDNRDVAYRQEGYRPHIVWVHAKDWPLLLAHIMRTERLRRKGLRQ